MPLPFNRILLVDDNDDDNLYHRIMLEEAQVCSPNNIDEVYNGREALDYLTCTGAYKKRLNEANRSPDLILLDLQMPIMDGWTFLSEYNNLDPKTRGKMIVVLLTDTKDNREVQDDEGNYYEFMSKPLTRKKIEHLVTHFKKNEGTTNAD